MPIQKPENIEEIINGLNGFVAKINNFPNGPRLYRELYQFVLLSMDFLEDITCKGWTRRITKGKFNGKYNLEFVRGIFFNKMFLEWSEPSRDRLIQGIKVIERTIYHRQPVYSERYEYKRHRECCRVLSQVELDQWLDTGIDDYYNN